MTVQRNEGPISMVPGADFMRTDAGVTWGIKCRQVADVQFVMIVRQQPDQTWEPVETIDDAFDMRIKEYASVRDYMLDLLVKIRAWLAKTFGPDKAPASAFDDLDAMILAGLQITAAPDGSLRASLK